MREARIAEAAVAPGRGRGGASRFEDDDVEGRVPLSGEQRRPQPCEACSHDREIALGVPLEARFRSRRPGVVEPEHRRRGIAEGGMAWHLGHARLPYRVAAASAEFLTMITANPSSYSFVHCGSTSSASTAGAPGTSMT